MTKMIYGLDNVMIQETTLKMLYSIYLVLGSSDKETVTAAATCIAAIGVLEIPKGLWNELIMNLA